MVGNHQKHFQMLNISRSAILYLIIFEIFWMNQPNSIESMEELHQMYSGLEKKCQMIEDFEDPGATYEELITQFSNAQKYIAQSQLFSDNEKLKQIQTQYLKFLALPYHVGYLYGKISKPRKEAIEQSRNYFEAFLNMMDLFHSEDEELFPQGIKKTWREVKEKNDFNFSREQVIANHKEKKEIEKRYEHSLKIKEESDQRQSIRDYLALKIYEAVTQLKNIEEEKKILQYKATIEKDPEEKEKHNSEMEKPLPKMKVWHVKKPEQIQSDLIPNGLNSLSEKKKQLVAQVWEENANKPTMSLEEVAELEYDNMQARMKREAKQKEENQVDTDSDKEEVDERMKKESRAWDDWKDDNEKGAGNRGNR